MSQVFHRPRTERVRKLRVFETTKPWASACCCSAVKASADADRVRACLLTRRRLTARRREDAFSRLCDRAEVVRAGDSFREKHLSGRGVRHDFRWAIRGQHREFAGPPIPSKHDHVLRRHGPHRGSPRPRTLGCRLARRSESSHRYRQTRCAQLVRSEGQDRRRPSRCSACGSGRLAVVGQRCSPYSLRSQQRRRDWWISIDDCDKDARRDPVGAIATDKSSSAAQNHEARDPHCAQTRQKAVIQVSSQRLFLTTLRPTTSSGPSTPSTSVVLPARNAKNHGKHTPH